MKYFITSLAFFLASIGLIPLVILILQFLLVGLHRFRSHYAQCQHYIPNTAIIVPAWNEGDVVGRTIDTLLSMNYPRHALRIYIVDDGSTDDTPKIVQAKNALFPQNVYHLRRENGGQGKAHTLNYGLQIILADDWVEAILIMDADVLFEKNTLSNMARHLADPQVGCVTAYVKEGNTAGNLITRFIAYEYIASQAASRRSQNVLGVLACLAGGAQLHSRANIEAIGGKIDTSTMAEDTYTTFETQLNKRRAIFDGNAFVRAEEPGSLQALWKQRLRWGRGNFQLTLSFRRLWFQGGYSGLGGIFFALVWFSVLLMPFFMILSSIGLVTLFFLDIKVSFMSFQFFSLLSAFAYLFVTIYCFLLDLKAFKRVWFAGIVFPGIISLVILSAVIAPNIFNKTLVFLVGTKHIDIWHNVLALFANAWVSLCMLFAWLVYRLDRLGVSQKITNTLLLFFGYGPVLCAISLASFMAEVTKMKLKWDKTEKVGKVKPRVEIYQEEFDFQKNLAEHIQIEKNIFWYEWVILLVIFLFFVTRYYYNF